MTADEELDLYPYLLAVIQRWRILLALTVAATLLGGGLSASLPREYEVAGVLSTLAAGGEPGEAAALARTYAESALSDGVLIELGTVLGSSVSDRQWTVEQLRGALRSSADPGTGSLVLKVRDYDPKRAVSVAEAWSDLLVRLAATPQIAPVQSQNRDNLDREIQRAEVELDRAEGELAVREMRLGTTVLQTELTASSRTLEELVQEKNRLLAMVDEATLLLGEIRRSPPSKLVDRAQQHAVDAYWAKLYGASLALQTPAVGKGSTLSTGELRIEIESLVMAANTRMGRIEERMARAYEHVLDIRAQLQSAMNARTLELVRRDVARGELNRLVSKSLEPSPSGLSPTQLPRLSKSVAQPPTVLPRDTTRHAVAAGALGLLLGLVVAAWLEARSRRSAPASGVAGHTGSRADTA